MSDVKDSRLTRNYWSHVDGQELWMLGKAFVRNLLTARPVTGKKALFWAVALLGVPTVIRLSLGAYVSAIGFIPYTPFVLVAALILRWQAAAAIAVVASLLGDFLFVGQPYQILEAPNEVFGEVAFLVASAMIIWLGSVTKSIVADPLWLKGPDPQSSGVVFSLESGQAHVSWYGERSFVHLGPEQEVAEMMRDFLAQREVAARLTQQDR